MYFDFHLAICLCNLADIAAPYSQSYLQLLVILGATASLYDKRQPPQVALYHVSLNIYIYIYIYYLLFVYISFGQPPQVSAATLQTKGSDSNRPEPGLKIINEIGTRDPN